jgi:hypothetical protein
MFAAIGAFLASVGTAVAEGAAAAGTAIAEGAGALGTAAAEGATVAGEATAEAATATAEAAAETAALEGAESAASAAVPETGGVLDNVKAFAKDMYGGAMSKPGEALASYSSDGSINWGKTLARYGGAGLKNTANGVIQSAIAGRDPKKQKLMKAISPMFNTGVGDIMGGIGGIK